MNHIFIVSPTLKDAHGIFGLLYEMMHNRICLEDVEIEFIQPVSEDGELDCYNFGDESTRFCSTIPDGNRFRLIHRPNQIPNIPDGNLAWAEDIAKMIAKCDGQICILLDLGAAYENKDTTELYHALREVGMDRNCILYAPFPDSYACKIWKKKNGCTDLIVRRSDVTRARAIYVPMGQRFCEILHISD